MCKVPALCIDHIEHEEDFHARACPLRGDKHEKNERSTGAGNRLAEDMVGQGKATTESEWGAEGTGQYEQRQLAAARTNPALLCLNEQNTVQVRALPPQWGPR